MGNLNYSKHQEEFLQECGSVPPDLETLDNATLDNVLVITEYLAEYIQWLESKVNKFESLLQKELLKE